MAADDTRIVDLVDTVHHEINSTVRSHRVYKFVWSPAIGKQLILEKEPSGQSIR